MDATRKIHDLPERCNGFQYDKVECCSVETEAEGMAVLKGQYEISNSRDRSTDKYWCSFFFLIVIIWIISWYYAIYHYSQFNSNIHSDNITLMKNATTSTRFYFWGENWIFDMLTCNVAFLSTHYENSGSIVILANALFCTFLLVYSLISMQKDEIFYVQLLWSGACFGLFTLTQRLFLFTRVWFKNVEPIPQYIPYHENVQFWLMPELIFIIILYTKQSYGMPIGIRIGKNFDDLFLIGLYTVVIGFLFLCLPLYELLASSVYILEKLGSDCILPYVITGCNCYLALTIYYFELMVASRITEIILTQEEDVKYEDFRTIMNIPLNAFATVGRYNFGTACCRATLIFPRLETLFLVNDPEVKEWMPDSTFIGRLLLMQGKLHNLSLVLTARHGSNHSESMKELISDILPDIEYFRFQSLTQIFKSLLAFFMSMNSLMLIWLWTFGVNDAQLSLTTFTLYAYVMLTVYPCMKIFDAVSDTMIFYMIDEDYKEHLFFSSLSSDEL